MASIAGAAIEMALRENSDVGNETIPVVFFLDRGLERCQQMFADLNRHAVRPSKSIGVLYDHRDSMAIITRTVILKSLVFRGLVEMERSTLSLRASKLFTLSAMYLATRELVQGLDDADEKTLIRVARDYWEALAEVLQEWKLVAEHQIKAGEVRTNFIHSHGVVLHALGIIGNQLLRDHPKSWRRKLAKLKGVDWSRQNSAWEGRAIVGGRVAKSSQNVTLTVNWIKMKLDLPLSPEEERAERARERASGSASE